MVSLRFRVEQKSQTFLGIVTFEPFKKYFDVTNVYILKKLGIVYCPFAFKNWKKSNDEGFGSEILSGAPRLDLLSNDLYIPIMAFTSAILLTAFSDSFSSGNLALLHAEIQFSL